MSAPRRKPGKNAALDPNLPPLYAATARSLGWLVQDSRIVRIAGTPTLSPDQRRGGAS